VTTFPVPALPVFPAGYEPQVSDFTGWVTDSLGFCTNSVVFRAEQQSSQSFAANTETTVTWDTVLEDPYSGWQAGSNAWLAPVSGWFAVTSTLIIASASGTLSNTIFLTGGTEYTASAVQVPSTNPGGSCATFWIPMIAGTDFVQTLLFMTQSGTTDAGQGQRSTLEIEFVAVQ
jgi:hypothetical protein